MKTLLGLVLLNASLCLAQNPAPPAEATKAPAESKPLPSTTVTVPPKHVPGLRPVKQGNYTGRVIVISVGEEDLITPARFEFMSRTLKRATEEGAAAVVFDLDTPGGLAWQTTTFIMQDLEKLGCRSIAFVNPRALSAGALIAAGTDAIYMTKTSSVGAATPISGDGQKLDDAERAKMNSAMMAMARTTAKAKGHNPAVIEAMIDKDVGLKIGEDVICEKGRILTLDADQATKVYEGKPLFAKGIASDLGELLKRENIKGDIVRAEPQGFEKIAILITKFASILILIGLAGVYLEMQHPGMSIPGIIAAVAFGIFFFGHFIAGSLAGYETVVIFLIGLGLLAVEFFIFPGHVIPGLVGMIMVLGALIYTMAGWDVTVPEGGRIPVNLSAYAVPLRNLGIALLGSVATVMMLMRYLPNVGPFRQLILHTSVGGAQAAIEGEAQSRAAKVKIGDAGSTLSAMRPWGNVNISGLHFEAVVEGDYLPPQTPVRVVAIDSGKVIVARA